MLIFSPFGGSLFSSAVLTSICFSDVYKLGSNFLLAYIWYIVVNQIGLVKLHKKWPPPHTDLNGSQQQKFISTTYYLPIMFSWDSISSHLHFCLRVMNSRYLEHQQLPWQKVSRLNIYSEMTTIISPGMAFHRPK